MQETRVRSVILGRAHMLGGRLSPCTHSHWACSLVARSRDYWRARALRPVLHMGEATASAGRSLCTTARGQPWKWVLATRSCPALCDPVDCSPPGSSVYGILQARVLEWVAISSSRASSWPRDQTQVSCIAGRCFTFWAAREAQRVALVTAAREKLI